MPVPNLKNLIVDSIEHVDGYYYIDDDGGGTTSFLRGYVSNPASFIHFKGQPFSLLLAYGPALSLNMEQRNPNPHFHDDIGLPIHSIKLVGCSLYLIDTENNPYLIAQDIGYHWKALSFHFVKNSVHQEVPIFSGLGINYKSFRSHGLPGNSGGHVALDVGTCSLDFSLETTKEDIWGYINTKWETATEASIKGMKESIEIMRLPTHSLTQALGLYRDRFEWGFLL